MHFGSSDAVLRHVTSSACSWRTARASLRSSPNAAARLWRSRSTRGTPIDPSRAEAAFLVADALQGRGIGTRLLEELAEHARDHGIETLSLRGCSAATTACSKSSSIRASTCARRPNRGVIEVALSLGSTTAA